MCLKYLKRLESRVWSALYSTACRGSIWVLYRLYSRLQSRLSGSMFRLGACWVSWGQKICHSLSLWQLAAECGHRDAADRSQRVKMETARTHLRCMDASNHHVTVSWGVPPHSACSQREGSSQRHERVVDIFVRNEPDATSGAADLTRLQ